MKDEKLTGRKNKGNKEDKTKENLEGKKLKEKRVSSLKKYKKYIKLETRNKIVMKQSITSTKLILYITIEIPISQN